MRTGSSKRATSAAVESGALAPPGWYLVFVVNEQGAPSTGQWLHSG
ncbi:galactose oxidase-like domain-containing protein [Nocardia sp. NPDC051990]